MKDAMPLSPPYSRLVTAAGLPMIGLDLEAGPSIAQQIAQAEARPAQSFYAGRTIKLIVGLPPGGGADAYARLLQRHLARHIPGTPAIIIQNMPGAGSL